MKISKLVLGMISTNCYIVVDNGEAMIVDPAAGADKILAELKKFKDVKVKYIALTHAHWDHLLATPELVAKTGAKVLCHEEDLDKLFSKKIADESPRAVQKAYAEGRAMGIEPQVLHEGDTFTVGTKTFEVIHTPGHTRGSVCFYCKEEKVLFTGDTIFAGGRIGRTDFDDGNIRDMTDTLRKKFTKIHDDAKVLPGHEGTSTMINERMFNEYIH